MEARGLTRVFNTDVNSKGFFLKQVIGGAFITIAMTGLDQEMMQKNISVNTLGNSRKNMLTFSAVLVFVNLLFLLLGGLLYLYAYHNGAEFRTVTSGTTSTWGFFHADTLITGDRLFPSVAMGLLQSMPAFISVVFIIALISALFPSADGALTALTSTFCIDILGLRERDKLDERQKRRIRLTVHLSLTLLFFFCVLVFWMINSRSIIDKILDLAGYTYGPLLGLFSFGILTKRRLPDSFLIALIAVASPVACYFLQLAAPRMLGGYVIGIEILIINGLLTFLGLLAISKKQETEGI
jgi:hypothetical protein